MRITRAVPILLALALAHGCGEDSAAEVTTRSIPETPRGPTVQFGESDYTSAGELRESSIKVAGLELPRGLKAEFAGQRRHVFSSPAPIGRIVSFFGPRLMTAEVARDRDAITYLHAAPKGAVGSTVKLDVSIRPRVGGGTLITIVELDPQPQREVTETELRTKMVRDSAYWD